MREGQPVNLGLPAFDALRPPARRLVDDCVHCGFCLPTCPTYVLWGAEMDSPRGRIHLMKQGLEGEPLTPAMVQHWDRCLGCMACMTACPSGVQYGSLIEATRAQVERRHRRSLPDRALRALIFGLFPYPRRLRRLRPVLRLLQWLRLDVVARRSRMFAAAAPRLAAMQALTPRITPSAPATTGRVAAVGPRRAVVGMLTGCVQSQFFPEVNEATVRVLAAEGCEVVIPEAQGCCGALSAHNGRDEEARRYARALVDKFEGAAVEQIVVNAAGCGSTMKEYAELLADDPSYAARAEQFARRVRDVSELLCELGTVAPRHPVPVTVAYHDACHLAHAQGVRDEPRRLLAAIPSLTVREIVEGDLCCGSAGIYNILQPEPARDLGDRKAANVVATGAELLVTANPGCLMQIGAALERADRRLPMAHTVQLLDASIRGLDVAQLVQLAM